MNRVYPMMLQANASLMRFSAACPMMWRLSRPKYSALVPSVNINRGDNEIKIGNSDLKPEMSAYEVCDNLVDSIKSDKYDVIIGVLTIRRSVLIFPVVV